MKSLQALIFLDLRWGVTTRMKIFKRIGILCSSCLGLYVALPIAQVLAEPTIEEKLASAQVAADTSWMLISTALVLLMTPGLAFFY